MLPPIMLFLSLIWKEIFAHRIVPLVGKQLMHPGKNLKVLFLTKLKRKREPPRIKA